MVTLRNTTTADVCIVIKGISYCVEAGSVSKPLNEEVAIVWKRTHSFLIQEDIQVAPKPEKAEKSVEELVKKPKVEVSEPKSKKAENKVKKIKK